MDPRASDSLESDLAVVHEMHGIGHVLVVVSVVARQVPLVW